MDEIKPYITIFGIGAGKDGQSTLRFEDVTNLTSDNNTLTFNYVSASTGQKHYAEFNIKNIAGYSMMDI